uniref:Uncharacterized protein AlNc14C9G1152 n=1 Tax=Albugo laibachii Nc14 TaxID=890382 RepID=F0W299_9STRA|nr:conserved hypothetical protein [Albugo laibachii Nc14]|eukprot:CCA15184.1 conserved hypothetical protein [Albugo laibachii Nc14]
MSDTPVHRAVEAEELIALIQAIKFAHPEYGVKRIHDKIRSHGSDYASVSMKRIKKYMKKIGLTNSICHEKDMNNNKVVHLMTIGGKSKSDRFQGQGCDSSKGDELKGSMKGAWLPVKLDEPASKMTQFPYQAVIQMKFGGDGDATGSMGEIYKIQVAADPGNSDKGAVEYPMMVYNKARNRKTFMHPESPAYAPVQKLIASSGATGVAGGTKAYFWGQYRSADDMLHINTEALAPFQNW